MRANSWLRDGLRCLATGSLLMILFGSASAASKVTYYGILMPLAPKNYSVLLSHLEDARTQVIGGFTFHTGTLSGIPVVACVQPVDGDATRALVAQKMMDAFSLRAMIYAGTSGSHLKRLRIGDVLIARRVVDFGNYITTRSGRIIPGEFHDTESNAAGSGAMMYLYPSVPLSDLAYRAAMSMKPETPAWMNQNDKPSMAYIMDYGTQGSSAMWLRNPKAIRESDRIFHEADESGGYGTALASLINKVPFVELNVMSDNALQVPTKFDTYFHRSSLYAQQLAYEIVLRMFEMIKAGDVPLDLDRYRDMMRSPYPADTRWNH
ncbi:5'-methylthioadenosine/S-adenosylhomocysteine nucleosidase family protein [Acidihalobacter prosperus]|nr:hypothetical protein [Acidihalobacter prosperus]